MKLFCHFLWLGVLSPPAFACDVCYGKNGAAMTQAMNVGIVVMVGLTFAVLAAFGVFFLYLNRRAAAYAHEGGDLEFAEDNHTENAPH